MNPLLIVLSGALGGLLPDLLRIVKNRYEKDLPEYLKYPMFWIGLVILVVLGAFTAYLVSASSILQAVACGFSAPELLSRLLAKESDEVGQRRAKSNFELRAWWNK